MLSNLTQHFRKKPAPVFQSIDPEEDKPEHFQAMDDVLFAGARIAPQIKPHFDHPRSDLAGFFTAFREAAERFAMTHIAPLAALNSSVRFQVRTIAVYVKPENDRLLHELQALSPHIIKTAAVNCLNQSRVADQFDLDEFFGIIVVAGEEVASGEAVMTLATVGIERINIEFEFEGEHVSRGDAVTPTVEMAPATDITFRLVHPDGRVEPLGPNSFPLLIGKSPEAGISVSGTYVSREHATLYFDPVLRRVVIQDHSRHGTWLNGKRLDQEGRGILRGSGQIRLALPTDSDGPVIEFSHGTIEELQPTPLTPMLACAATVEVDGQKDVISDAHGGALALSPIVSVTPDPIEPAAVPPAPTCSNETQLAPKLESVLSGATPTTCTQETQLCDLAGRNVMAWLQVRTQDSVSTLPITELPFVIGREPKGAGFSVHGQAAYVSREHLKLLSFHHKCFTIENGGLGRNNTYRKGVLQDNRFLYQPVPPSSDSGWVVLGGHRLDEKCVEVRLLTAAPVGKP